MGLVVNDFYRGGNDLEEEKIKLYRNEKNTSKYTHVIEG